MCNHSHTPMLYYNLYCQLYLYSPLLWKDGCCINELNLYTDNIFPYGARSGDEIVPHAVDISVGIMLNVSVVFFHEKETNINVSLE